MAGNHQAIFVNLTLPSKNNLAEQHKDDADRQQIAIRQPMPSLRDSGNERVITTLG